MQELNIIVLVGTNPLPCYVAARQLIVSHRQSQSDQPYRLWLVHSENNSSIRQQSTLPQASRVRDALQKQKFVGPTKPEFIGLSDVGSPSAIRREVLSALTDKIKDQGGEPIPIHIDYTGGTKSMGVSVAQVANELSGLAGFTFSYLDARSSTLVFDGQDPQLYRTRFGVPDTGRSTDLRKTIHITAPELLELHGIKYGDSPKFPFDKTDAIIDGLIQSGGIEKFINEGVRKIRTVYGDSRDDEKYKKFDSNVTSYLKKKDNNNDLSIPNEETQQVMASPELKSLVTATPDGKLAFRSTFETKTRDEVIRALEYLDGHWLENYVYGVCDTLRKQLGPGVDVCKGIDARPVTARSGHAHSDIDVAFVSGYQLTAISITTSRDRKICKGKGFEVLLRAEQLGGEESRSVLVTALSQKEPESLQEDLRIASGSIAGHFIVLGLQDWKRVVLSTQLKNHITA